MRTPMTTKPLHDTAVNPGRKSNARWVVAGLMWFAIAINYIDRTVLSVAAPELIKEFSLTPEMMGIVLSAFFWSYALLQIPAGWVADKFGQKMGLGIAVGSWSLATAATGLATGLPPWLACAWHWASVKPALIRPTPESRQNGFPTRNGQLFPGF